MEEDRFIAPPSFNGVKSAVFVLILFFLIDFLSSISYRNYQFDYRLHILVFLGFIFFFIIVSILTDCYLKIENNRLFTKKMFDGEWTEITSLENVKEISQLSFGRRSLSPSEIEIVHKFSQTATRIYKDLSPKKKFELAQYLKQKNIVFDFFINGELVKPNDWWHY